MDKPNELKSAFGHGNPTHGGELGLTKREYFAALAMQGMLANSAAFMGDDPNLLATKSLWCADELLKQLTSK